MWEWSMCWARSIIMRIPAQLAATKQNTLRHTQLWVQVNGMAWLCRWINCDARVWQLGPSGPVNQDHTPTIKQVKPLFQQIPFLCQAKALKCLDLAAVSMRSFSSPSNLPLISYRILADKRCWRLTFAEFEPRSVDLSDQDTGSVQQMQLT